MIERVEFPEKGQINSDGPLAYLKNIDALAGKAFTFKPGLNVIIGPNGSGKSTILNALALHTAAKQGGITTVTNAWIEEMCRGGKCRANFRVTHDGQSVRHIDPREAIGLIGGMAAFDFDFGSQGIMNATFKGSSGQTTLARVDAALREVIENQPAPAVAYRVDVDKVRDHYRPTVEAALSLLKPTIKKGERTFLFDEPDANLSLPYQYRLWSLMRQKAINSGNQVIVVSHSPFCLGLRGVHYIETEPKYHVEALKSLLFFTQDCFGLQSPDTATPEDPVEPIEKPVEPTGDNT